MSPALYATSNNFLSRNHLRGKGAALEEYEHHVVGFGLAEMPARSFWPVVWALLLNRCDAKHDDLFTSMCHLIQHDADWTMQPLTVTMDPQATVASVVDEGVDQGSSVRDGEKSFHTDTMVGVVANGEVAEEDLLSEMAQCMTQWDLVLGLAVVVNKKLTQHQAHFVYRPGQIPSDTLIQLADQFLHAINYVNQNGLNVRLVNVLECMGKPTFTSPLYRHQPLVGSRRSEPVMASTEQTRIRIDSRKYHHRFYHLVVIHPQIVIDSVRVQSAVHRLTKQFPILVSRFVDQMHQVMRCENIDSSNLVAQVAIDEVLMSEPDKLRALLHDAHHLNDADRPLFSVVELVPTGSNRIEWLSVYCHYVLGDQSKFHCWVEQLQNLISNPPALPLSVLDASHSGDGLDLTEFWKTHFSNTSLYLDLDGQQSQPLNHTGHANRYEPVIPSSLVSHLPLLMESMSMCHLELLQGFMTLFILRLARQSSVALFGQADHNSVVPWVAQITDEISTGDTLHSLVEQYRQSTQYDWSQFSFPVNSRKPTICVMALSMLPGCAHDFGQPYAETPLSLTWLHRDDNSAMKLVVDYDKGVYHTANIENLVKNFLFFTSQCCADITQDWRNVDVVHPDEQSVLLHEFATTKHDYNPYDPMAHGVLDLFIRNVRQYPESVAVECGDHRETYRSLYEKVQALVTHFQSMGIQRQERIAVVVESNVFTIMTLLALWTLGAVYVPIDSQLPQERKQYMMETAGCTRVLSTTVIKPDWTETLAIQDVLGSISSSKRHEVLPGANIKHLPDEIAYIVFTSGTTGQPKGLTAHHGAFNNLIVTHPLLVQECPWESRWLLTVGVTFDAYLYGTFLSLCYGWTLVLASHEIIMDVVPTINGIFTTPSFIAALDPENYPMMKWIAIGGETLPQTLSDKWSPHCRLYNGYGPAETTVIATIKEVKPGNQVTIGRPLPNRECYILDNRQQLLPVGILGEIYIGGVGVSQGYINRPDLNVTRFLPNPFNNGRLYRTGDYGRWLPNGELDFVGRIDEQVKLRGFRVELNEVRGGLLKQQGVRDAFVSVVDKKLLVGFIIGEPEIDFSNSELRKALQKCLPEYMVPHHLVVIQDQSGFPRTVNGKVDQQRLLTVFQNYRAQQLDVEEGILSLDNLSDPQYVLVTAISKALELPLRQLSLTSSLLQLGGDSVSAVQISVQCRQQGWNVPVSLLLQEDSLEIVSQLMDRLDHKGAVLETDMASFSASIRRWDMSPIKFDAVQRELSALGWKPGDVQGVYPMLSMQQGMMAATARDPAEYVVQLQVTLHGILSKNDITEIVWSLVQSYDATRVHFMTNWSHGNTHGLQIIKTPTYEAFLRDQWCQLGAGIDGDSYARNEVKRGFGELTPTIRFAGQRIATDCHKLLITAHHAVVDGWSVGILLRSLLWQLNLKLDRMPEDTMVPPSFGDYSLYVHNRNIHPAEASKTYWQEYLANVDTATIVSLPSDLDGMDSVEEAEAVLYGNIPKLSDVLKTHAITLYTLIQTAWALTLNSYTGGQTDLLFGQVLSGREETSYTNIDKLVGCLVNTLPVRIQLTPGQSVLNLLKHVQRQHHRQLQHQHCHLTDINQWLDQPDLRVSELFNTLLVYQSFPSLPSKNNRLQVLEPTFIRSSEFALTPMVEQSGEQLVVRISHRPCKFHAEYVVRIAQYMAGCFHHLVASLIDSGGYTPALVPFNGMHDNSTRKCFATQAMAAPTCAIDTTLCVHDILKREAYSVGDRIAIEYGDSIQWNYSELYQRSQYIAYGLLANGVKREETVGLVIERQPSAIAAMFGILMTGAAYVPMNADFPVERIRFIVQDCGIRIVLTNTSVDLDGVEALNIDTLLDRPAAESPLPQVKPTDLSHIIYTSGTTGNPKGVQQEHRTVANYVQQPEEVLGIVPGLRMMQSMSLASDCSTIEVFGGLCNGVTLVLRTDMLDTLAKVDTVMLTPSVLATIDPSRYPNIRRVLVGGEVLPLQTAERWARHCRLFNVYGPSECFATHAVEYRVGDPVTIGRVIGGIEAYILDDQLRPVPFGVPGEIFLGGIGLTRGYIKRPELNQSKFVTNPFSPDGGRLYRSGDLGRWLIDGTVEYFARKDDQVKIRGYRVEPQEVEAVIVECPGVVSAAVLPHDAKLYGFCSPESVDIYKVKEYLDQRLPPYMVPQNVFSLVSIPLTVVGKIDRPSLKIILEQQLAHSDERVVKGPTNATEQVIHEAMGETLGISLDHLNVRDSFFQLGGDSILAIRFSSLCRERGIQLSIAQIFRYKSVASLAELVSDVDIADAPLPPLAPWELTLLDCDSNYIPTEAVTLIIAEELLSVLPSALSSVVQTISIFNLRYDSIGRRLVYQPHPMVNIDQDAKASHILDPSQGVWLSGTYTRECSRLNVITLVAHLVPLGRVGGWSTILQGMAKQCPDLVASPNPVTMDTLLCSHTPKYASGSIHQLTMSYSGNPFCDDLLHSELHAPLSVVIMAGFLMTLQKLQVFDSVGIIGSGNFARYITKRLNSDESTSHIAEFQLIKQWYYDQLIHGGNPDKPESPVLYHYSDVCQPHGIPLVEQRTSFWDTMYDTQAAVIYQPNTVMLQLYHHDATVADSLLTTWKDQVNRLLDIPNQLRGIEHIFIPADFPHLAITSDDLEELMCEIYQDLGIPPAAVQDVYPLSTMQQNFVVNTLRDPTSYIVQHVFHITGALDLVKYRTVWDELGLRHTILRTKFLASRMVQVVTDHMDIDWLVSDVPLSTSNEEYQHTVRQRGFNLFGGHPLLRIHLFPDGDGHGWLCFMAIHHAVIDGWSYQMMMNESLSLYHELRLTAKVSYRQFIDAVSTRDITIDKKYWSEFLEGFESTPDLPFPHLTQVSLYRKDTVVLNQTEPLRRLCRSWGITFNVLLRGVWALMLAQYLGKPDEVTFGVMVSGRDGQINGLDRLMGPTINTLPFRAKVDLQKSVVEWLQELAEQSTQLLEHEQTSLVDIKYWAGLDADDQLFRSMIAVGRYLESESPVEASLIEYHSLSGCNDTEYPLMASFDEPVSGGALHLTILARHEPYYVDGLIDCIGYILTKVVEVDPSLLSVESLMKPSPTALSQVQAWSPGPAVVPSSPDVVMVPDLFTQRLAHQPQQEALETKEGQYTYRECYAQACRIGHALLDGDLQPGDRVALLFTRSASYFMALLGTWLVGGVAVPMDATNAPNRLQFMVDSLGEGSFLVTRTADDSGQVILPDYYTAKLIVDDMSVPADSTTDLPAYPRDPTMLALIIYTSGTTGVPKGVMLRHESILNFISYGTQFMSVSSTSRFLQALNIVFDGCFIEILTVWSVGGTLVLQDSELVDDLKRVTHCLMTPSMLGVLNPEDYPQLELVSTIGEALSCNVANRWLATGKRVLNAFGPAEITMACHLDLVIPHEPVSIGRPIANSFCYILDDQHNLVPPGVPGEICIAGIGVSSGYWSRLDLTSKAFIDNPFGSGKMYFTGDLGCWLPSGKVHYIGRKDNQVKLRGFRIELGEVESWCERMCSTIQQAVALVVNKQLVTYVSPQSVDENEVALALKRALPYYMVPTHIISVDNIPKTRNGKVDRRALAEYPLPQTLTSNITFVDNASEFNDTYRMVARLALQALQFAEDHPLPAPSTSFFAAGGDSISAVSFSSLCRKQGLNVTVAKIFTLQTLGAISEYCETESEKENGELKVPTLTHFQRWLNEEKQGSANMMVEVQDPDQPLYVLKQPLGFTSVKQWQSVLGKRNSAQMEIGNLSEAISTNEAGLTAECTISSSVFPMFTTDKLYGQYQCTLSEMLLAGFLMAWWKNQQDSVDVDLFRLTDNKLVNTHWQQSAQRDILQSPLAWLQSVKETTRNATWSDISSGDNGHPHVLFHMVDPVVGMNIIRQRQQRLVPLLGTRRRYDLEAMAWYQMDGTVTLVVYSDSSTNCEIDEKFVQKLPTLWKHATKELLACNSGTAWLPSDFPLVPFEDVQQLTMNPTRVQTVWPFSSLQQGFVIESLKDPSAYMVQLVYELHGVLDVDRYHQAWLTVGQRHDAMRVQFCPERRVQVVMRDFNLEWSCEAKNLSDADIPEYLIRMREKGFVDLTSEPLLRVQLLQQNEARHLCFITIHHAVVDAWSIDIVLGEVQRVYHGLALTTTPVSYGKFLKHVAKLDLTQTQSFWKKYMHGMEPTPDLPMPKLNTNPVESETQQLSTPLRSIRTWCGKLGITVNSLVRGLWALLLGRYLGQDTCEVTFAVMVTGRNGHIDGIDEMVGLTVNTIPFRVKLEREDSMDTWLKAIHAQSGSLMDHDRVGLLDIETWTSQKSPFQSMLVNTKSRTVGFGNVSDAVGDEIQWVNKGGYNQVNFPLTVGFTELPDKNGLEVKIAGNHGVAYFAGLITYLEFCLSTLVECSDTISDWPLGRMLDLIPPTELNRISTWSQGTHTSYDGKPRLVHELVTGNNEESKLTDIALESLDSPLILTYGELISQSQLVAQHMLSLDTPGQFILLFFRHSSAFLVAMLGSLMAGKTCVPMNAEHASERLVGMTQILGEAHPVVLTSKEHRTTAQELFGDTVFCVDDLTLSTVTSKSPVERKPPCVNPSDIAIIFFTSGSTGKPKAVPQRHESIVNCILGMSELMNLSKDCRCLQTFNIGFDASLVMLFMPLYAGGTLVLPGDDMIEGLSRTDTWMMTPSMLQAVGDPEQYNGLGTVFLAGEPLSHALAKKWRQACDGQLKFVNGYGPTEAIVSHFEEVVHTRDSNLIAIGKTIPNVQCYLLDGALHMVPVGVIGEICISGIGVSYGYLNDEQRSRGVFVPNPFKSGILYRTGDLGCWLPDGRVYCIGRKDTQVKLRGFRIELAEVESLCERLVLNIQQAAAMLVNKQLVTYVSPQSVDVDEVTLALKHALPYYMVPAHIIPVDDMPKTRNGKVDRRALAEYPLPQTLTSNITFVENASECNDTYRMVARLALQALQFAEDHPLPAPSTSFFAAGGDSISAVSFSSLCRKQGLNVTVAKIFTLQTLGAISEYCEKESEKENGELKVPTLTHFQRWLNEEKQGSANMMVEVQDPDQPLYVLKQPLGFTSVKQWQSVLGKRNSAQMEIGNSSKPMSTNETGMTAEWTISSSEFPMFTTDKLYGKNQCTLSELLLAGFLLMWWKTRQGNVDVDLFRLTDNELVNTHWQQETQADNLQSPLAWLQSVKETTRNATWSDISSGDNGHPHVLFHMVDPVVGMNIIRQRQQRLVPLLGTRRQYVLEAMMWYQMDGTVTLVIHRDSLTKVENSEEFVQYLPTLWKHATKELLACNSGTAWLPSDFPLVPFEDVQQLTMNPTRVQTVWPLSSLQQGFVIESLKDPSAYMVQLVYELQGLLDIDRYHQAWFTVGQRHDAMRVQFHPDQSVQVVMREFNLEWEYGERIMSETEVPGYLLRMRQRGFTDLTDEPLFRIQLFKQNSVLHLCFITVHHAILDAWSIDVVLGEVRRLYEGLALTTSAVSYGRFLAQTTEIDPTQSQSFWKTYLENMEATPNLPLPTSENSPRESVTERLTTSLSLVNTWCSKLGITVNSLVRGLWALLLGRYLGKDTREVTFGVMVTGRDGEIDGVDEMVGLTVNTVPFRATLDRSRSVQSWLQDIHTQSGAMLSHSHVGLLEIETWVNQKPLFQSMLVNGKSRVQGMEDSSTVGKEGLRWVNKGGYNQVDYPLTVGFAEDGEFNEMHIQLSGQHRSSYYSSLLDYLNTVLAKMVVESSLHDHLTVGNLLDQIPRLELERIQTWSQGKRTLYYGKPRLVHDLVIQGKLPSQLNTVALVSLTPPMEFTYYELISRAQLVAQRLMAVNRSSRYVILFFERSPELVLSMLGTLTAGRACVPMDATHTSERLIGMYLSLDEAHPVVLTSQKYRDTAEKLFDGTIICVDDITKLTMDNLIFSDCKSQQVTPTDLAFVYFTSGSTGKPKAVPERHESVVNYILGGCDILNLPPRCRFLQAMNIGFDSCLLELFTTFHSGGTVVLQSDNLVDSLGKVDCCMLTPSMLQAVGNPSEYPDLRVVVTAGEPLPLSLAEKWCQSQDGQVRLYNTYGPTEAAVTSHFEQVTVTRDDSLVTIGRTIPNVQCYILDDNLDMVSIGVMGEICIGGMGVCHGYLNDEERSRDVFVPNPFGSGMLYRTGDLGYWLPDGRVYCMGRKDYQVKLRGFRVELGEVESAVYKSSPHVQQAVALVKQGKLVVYFASTDQQVVSITELLKCLSQSLPSFMVPDYVVSIAEIPHTSNGKVDRQQLSALTLPDVDDNTNFVQFDLSPMETELFTGLQDLIKDILRLAESHPPIRPGSSFFKLGGDSITAIQLSARSRRELGLDLQVRDIFHHQGILGALVKHASQLSRGSVLPANISVNVTRYPCTPLQIGMISALIKDRTAYIIQASFTVGPPLDILRFERAWSVVVDINPTLRTRFDYDKANEQWMQVIMEDIDLQWLKFTDKETYLAQDYKRGFTVDGPFIRCGCHPNKHQWVLTMHHSITDGWSSGLIFEQVIDIYHKLSEGQLVPSNVDNGYAQFAHYVCNQSTETAREFWQHELEDMVEGTLLSGDSTKATTPEKAEDSVRYVVDDIDELNQYIVHHGVTLSSLLRVVWALVLRRYTGREKDVVFGVVVSGRNVPVSNVDRITGLCINTIPCRIILEKHQTVEALITSVHQGSIRTHGYDCYPLGDVHKWSGFPANQEMFNTLLVVENLPYQSDGGLDLQMESVFNPTEYPLSALVYPSQDQLEISMNYHTSKFTAMFVQQLLDDFVHTLRSLLVDTSKSLVDLPVHFPELHSFVHNPADYPVRHAHYYVEQQVRNNPDHRALYDLSTGQEFTYGQLDTMSHYMALKLLKAVECKSVKADQIVGIVAQNTPGLVVAQFAVWKLGLAFVVIDPEYPVDRIQFIMSDTQCIAWIGHGREPPCSVQRNSPWISLEGLTDCLLSIDPLPQLPKITIDRHDLACVIYTSGSTGQPKGVLIEHGSTAHYLYAYQMSVANTTSQTISPTLVAPTFDVSIGEMWTTLSFGGMVLLTHNRDNFKRALKNATRVCTTPSLLSYFDPHEFSHLQQVIMSGEPATLSLIRKWQQGGIPQVVNVYGPCEVPIGSHYKIYDQCSTPTVVSVGQPLPGYKGVIMDSWMIPVPVGVIGEMWIGGETVARGYLHREELTRERFINTPIWGRLYRTGDLAHWLPNGDVQFLGRADNQVKVRGFRVELEEVERVILASVPDIGRVCIAYDSEMKILLGFVTPEDANVDQVLDALEDRVPHYMVPNSIVPVSHFPLSHNGKTDRKALLALPRQSNAEQDAHIFTPMETKLVAVLADVLKVNPTVVSPPKDTFFTLGGNSISAMHFVARCKNNGIHIDLVDINRRTTIAALAKHACERSVEPVTGIQSTEFTHGPFSLTPTQRSYFSAEVTDPHQWPVPLLMKVTFPRNLHVWCDIVTSLVSHHDMMRARFEQVDGEWCGCVLPIDDDPVKVNEVTLTNGTSYFEVIAEANRSMNFTTGPIYLACVMNHRGTQYFYLALHHLISDNISMNLLAGNIHTLLNGQPLPEKTLAYARWSQNLNGLRQGISFDPHELPSEGELVLPPVDVSQMPHSRPICPRFLSSHLDVTTTFALEQFGHLDVSVEDIILTGLLLAYTDVFNCTSIPLQYTSHGRNALGNSWDVSHTVGFFVNRCPIVLHRKEGKDLAVTLNGVQSVLRGVSDFAVKYMLSGQTMKSPIAYNFLGTHDISDSVGANGVEVLDIVTSDEFQRQRVNIDPMPLIFFTKYTGECLALFIFYESSLYSSKCMSTVLEKWEEYVRHIVHQLKYQE